MVQGFQPLDLPVIPVHPGQHQGQRFKPVDSPGHGVEVYLVPAKQNRVPPVFQPPFLHHAGTEAPVMLDVHGVHGAAVRVDADQIILFPLKTRKRVHFHLFHRFLLLPPLDGLTLP